jgi:NDP-sugar pyrophosphorylase family protein
MTIRQASATVSVETHPQVTGELRHTMESLQTDRILTTIYDQDAYDDGSTEPSATVLATLSQQKDSPTQVQFLKAKGGFFAVTQTQTLTYLALPGSQLQLPDLLLNLNGDLPQGRLNPGSATKNNASTQTVTRQAMILGAGLASRFVPVSGDLTGYAKPSVPLVGEDSVIVTLAKHLQRHGIRRILVNTFYKPDVLKAQLNSVPELEIVFIDEEEPSGTAGGLLKALDSGLVDRNQPLLVMQGDAVTDADLSSLLETHRQQNAFTTIGVKHISDDEVSQMAIVVTDQSGEDGESGYVQSFQEKPTLEEAGSSRLASIGFYTLSPQVFEEFQAFGQARWASSKEYDYAFHFFPDLLAKHERAIYARMIPQPFYWSDIGRPDQYIATVRDIYAGKLQVPLPPEKQRYFEEGIIYWEDAREKTQREQAILNGNIIVFNRRN